MRNAESKGEVERLDTHSVIPPSAFRIPHWSVLVRRVWVCMLVLLRFPRLVMVPGGAVLDLGLHHPRGDARRVLEHDLAADHPGPHQGHEPRHPEHPKPRSFWTCDAR